MSIEVTYHDHDGQKLDICMGDIMRLEDEPAADPYAAYMRRIDIEVSRQMWGMVSLPERLTGE